MKIHIAKRGDSLFKLAKKYGIEMQKLIGMNPQIENPDQIDVGMKIKIPSPTKPVTLPAYETVHQHVVLQGDTLWKLSKQWNIPLEAMIQANKQLKNPNALLTGEVVNIPKMNGNSLVEKAQLTAPKEADLTAPKEKADLTAPKEKADLTAPKEKAETAPAEEIQEQPIVSEAGAVPTNDAGITQEIPYAMPEMPKPTSMEPLQVPMDQQPGHHPFKQFEIPATEAMSFYDMPAVPEMQHSFDLNNWPQFPGQPAATETMPVEKEDSFAFTETTHTPMPHYEAAWPTYPNVSGVAPQSLPVATGGCGCHGTVPHAQPYTYSIAPQPMHMGWPQPYDLQTPGGTMPGAGYGAMDGTMPGAGYGAMDGTMPGAGYGALDGTAQEAGYGTADGVDTGYETPDRFTPGAVYGTTAGVLPCVGYGTMHGIVPGLGYGYGWPQGGVFGTPYGISDGSPYGMGYGTPYGLPYGTMPEAAYPSIHDTPYPGVQGLPYSPYPIPYDTPLVSTHEHKDYGRGGTAAADIFRSDEEELDKKAGIKQTAKAGSAKKSKSNVSKIKVSVSSSRNTKRRETSKSDNLPWINI